MSRIPGVDLLLGITTRRRRGWLTVGGPAFPVTALPRRRRRGPGRRVASRSGVGADGRGRPPAREPDADSAAP